MWTANNWKDYEVLDTSCGEKLERWGKYLLVRPDPQVIWNTPKKNPGWKKKNGHYHRSSKGGGEWEFFNLPDEWSIHYRELTFRLKPFSFKHTGLFPEQAANWDWFAALIRGSGKPVKVLNLFAYTGGATLAAAKAGEHRGSCTADGRDPLRSRRRCDHRTFRELVAADCRTAPAALSHVALWRERLRHCCCDPLGRRMPAARSSGTRRRGVTCGARRRRAEAARTSMLRASFTRTAPCCRSLTFGALRLTC